MIKIIVFLLINSFLLYLPQNAFAADVLTRMLYADEVESFKADQDALIIGQLIAQTGDIFTVKVHKVLNGSVDSDIITVKSDFHYGWAGSSEIAMKPKVNDDCVMSLKKFGSNYKNAWGIFKATSNNYKTLRLLSEDIKYPYYTGDIVAVEWYVNSGGTEKNFSFYRNHVYVKRPNGETRLIYLSEDNSAGISKMENVNDAKPANSLLNDKLLIIFIAVLCVSAIMAIIVKRKQI